MVVHHCAPGAQRHIGGARWSCTIVHRVHNSIWVVHDGRAPLCTQCTTPYGWCTMVVHHGAPGAQLHIGCAQWSCTIVHRVQDAILVVHGGRAPLCTGCTMPYWWCTMVVHHCARGAQRHIGGARWGCTIVHRVHNSILVLVHDGRAPLCTGCTTPYWWCTMVVHHCAPGAQLHIGGARWSCTIVHRVHNSILVVHDGRAPLCTGCTTPYWWCTMVVHDCAPDAQLHIGAGARWLCTIVHRMHNDILVVHDRRAPLCTGCTTHIGGARWSCTIVHRVLNSYWWCTMVVHHCAPSAQLHIGGARWSCTIVHRVHDAILVVHGGHAPLCTGCTTPYWWCTMVVHHCAPGARCHIGCARWLCTIVHRVHNAILVVHDGRAPLCTGCTTPYWWCTMVVHHCAPGAQRHIGGARWVCTIVHRVHNAILAVHDGRAPLCTGCTTPYWLCTMVVHHCAPGARRHIGGARWPCTMVHRVHNSILVVHDGHAPLCTGCTTPYWWCTMVMHHGAPGAQLHIGGARWTCTIVHRVHNSILVVHDGRAPLCTGCKTPYWWCTMVVHHCAPGAQCHIGGARWPCTIVHRMHDAILVVHDGRAPLCTRCTTPYGWCTMVVHHGAPGAQLHIGCARWSCTIVHRVHDAILVVHGGRAPLCTGCTMPYWWCTMGVHHCAPDARRHIGGAQWSCTIVHRVHDAIWVVHNGRAPWCTGCTTPYWWCTMVVHHCAPGARRHIGGARWSCTIVHRVLNSYWWCTMVLHHCAPGAQLHIGVGGSGVGP